MAKTIEITRSTEVDENTGGYTEGMVRKGAVVGKSERINASVMTADPHSASAVHHHGDQDTIVYARRGRAALVFRGADGKVLERKVLEPGDFAFIPAFAVHQEVNDGDEEVELIVHRSGPMPIVENLEGGWAKN